MERGDYLMKVMTEKGYNPSTLSKESGVPYTTIKSMLERNLKNASIDNVIKICKVLGISVESLETQEETSVGYRVAEEVSEYVTTSQYKMPIFGTIAAGALSVVDPVSEENVEYISVPRGSLGKYNTARGLFALKVNGESMNKVIPNGSYVVCKPVEIEDLKDDDIVIFSYDNEYSMKRFRRIEEDRVLIFSPESYDKRYRDIEISFDAPNDLKIYAKVIWYAVLLD